MNFNSLPFGFLVAPFECADPGASQTLNNTQNGRAFFKINTTGGASARTINAPLHIGQEILVYLDTDGGDLTVSITGGQGVSSVVLDDAGDWFRLSAISVAGTVKWVVSGHYGEASGIVNDLNGTAITATATELNAIADLSVNGAIVKTKVIALTAATHGTGSEVDTGFDLPAKSVLLNAYIDCTTFEATGTTKTFDVGLLSSESGGDADGFLDGVSVATSVGLKKGVFASTTGSNNTYVGAAGAPHTRGALLTELLLAGNDVANGGDGVAIPGTHLSTAVTAKSVSVTSGSALTEFAGSLVLVYVEVA